MTRKIDINPRNFFIFIIFDKYKIFKQYTLNQQVPISNSAITGVIYELLNKQLPYTCRYESKIAKTKPIKERLK
jgi:hypothetical protein